MTSVVRPEPALRGEIWAVISISRRFTMSELAPAASFMAFICSMRYELAFCCRVSNGGSVPRTWSQGSVAGGHEPSATHQLLDLRLLVFAQKAQVAKFTGTLVVA